jgi:hypothetical protein
MIIRCKGITVRDSSERGPPKSTLKDPELDKLASTENKLMNVLGTWEARDICEKGIRPLPDISVSKEGKLRLDLLQSLEAKRRFENSELF